MKKFLIGAAVASGILFTSISPALAATNSPSSGAMTNTSSASLPSNQIQPFSTSKPTTYWNLSSTNYSGSFQNVSNAGNAIYTNYYFSPSSSNQLKVDMNITGNQNSSQTYNFYLVDITTGGTVSGQTIPVDQGTIYKTFSLLNPNDFYCFEWKANGYNLTINGNFTVHY